MGLRMKHRQAIPKQTAQKCNRATKRRENAVFDPSTELTSCSRSGNARVLRRRARWIVVGRGVVEAVQVTSDEDERTKRSESNRKRRGRLTAGRSYRALCPKRQSRHSSGSARRAIRRS